MLRRVFHRITSSLRRPQTPDDLRAALDRLQRILDYRFRRPETLVTALIHRSYHGGDAGPGESNERMEFLGDSVLSLVVNDHLYHRYPERSEGDLTKMKSVIVSKQVLAHVAKKIGLGSFVLVSENARRAGVSGMESVLADTLEAVLGSIFLDGGFEAARACILRLLPDDMAEIVYQEDAVNYKSLLQEYVQALHKVPPRYRVDSTSGPDHDKQFTVEVCVHGNVLGRGDGKTKKHAEQEAAREAYRRLTNEQSA